MSDLADLAFSTSTEENNKSIFKLIDTIDPSLLSLSVEELASCVGDAQKIQDAQFLLEKIIKFGPCLELQQRNSSVEMDLFSRNFTDALYLQKQEELKNKNKVEKSDLF